MSTVLGPKHQWMYGKIIIMENMITDYIELAEKENWGKSINKKPITEFSRNDFPDLEAVIDLSNIHGSIQAMVDDVEIRFAELITGLLDGHPERMYKLMDEAYRFGTTFPAPACKYTDDALKIIRDHVLDGMPCDRTFEMYTTGDGSMHINALMDVHSSYWTNCGGDPANYYALRTRYMQGLLKDSGYQFTDEGSGHYRISPDKKS